MRFKANINAPGLEGSALKGLKKCLIKASLSKIPFLDCHCIAK